MKKNYGINFVKDYPVKGVNFLDINGLLSSPTEYQQVIDKFCKIINIVRRADYTQTEKHNVYAHKEAILTTESRGFLFGAPVAYKMNMPLVVVRKAGKIPNNPYKFHISNEYTNYDMEVDGDLLKQYNQFIYIDDILATGNTLGDINKALAAQGKKITIAAHVTSVDALKQIREQNEKIKSLRIYDAIQLQQ